MGLRPAVAVTDLVAQDHIDRVDAALFDLGLLLSAARCIYPCSLHASDRHNQPVPYRAIANRNCRAWPAAQARR